MRGGKYVEDLGKIHALPRWVDKLGEDSGPRQSSEVLKVPVV